ncbi:hypothetical protein D299_gp040 [Escherichia phage HX01]|nr:hypothetical protein D299_gp040 [Escherichia phage HX01]
MLYTIELCLGLVTLAGFDPATYQL